MLKINQIQNYRELCLSFPISKFIIFLKKSIDLLFYLIRIKLIGY